MFQPLHKKLLWTVAQECKYTGKLSDTLPRCGADPLCSGKRNWGDAIETAMPPVAQVGTCHLCISLRT